MTKRFSDQEIIDGIQKGGLAENQVLPFLYAHYKTAVLTFVTSNKGSQEEALDVYQDAVVAAYDNIKQGKFRGESALASYLYAIARFIWLNRLKRKKKEQSILDQQSFAEVGEDHLSVLLDTERSQILQETLGQLGDSCKEVLIYAVYYEYSMKEISEKMGFDSEQVARNKKYKCLKRLKDLLGKRPDLKEWLRG